MKRVIRRWERVIRRHGSSWGVGRGWSGVGRGWSGDTVHPEELGEGDPELGEGDPATRFILRSWERVIRRHGSSWGVGRGWSGVGRGWSGDTVHEELLDFGLLPTMTFEPDVTTSPTGTHDRQRGLPGRTTDNVGCPDARPTTWVARMHDRQRGLPGRTTDNVGCPDARPTTWVARPHDRQRGLPGQENYSCDYFHSKNTLVRFS
jgi:hypothetical protein